MSQQASPLLERLNRLDYLSLKLVRCRRTACVKGQNHDERVLQGPFRGVSERSHGYGVRMLLLRLVSLFHNNYGMILRFVYVSVLVAATAALLLAFGVPWEGVVIAASAIAVLSWSLTRRLDESLQTLRQLGLFNRRFWFNILAVDLLSLAIGLVVSFFFGIAYVLVPVCVFRWLLVGFHLFPDPSIGLMQFLWGAHEQATTPIPKFSLLSTAMSLLMAVLLTWATVVVFRDANIPLKDLFSHR